METPYVDLIELNRQRQYLRTLKPAAYVDNLFVFLQLLQRWTPENVRVQKCMKPYKNGSNVSTLSVDALKLVAEDIAKYINIPLNVLELGCGSGLASQLLVKEIQAVDNWVATDILPIKSLFMNKFSNLQFEETHAVQAVVDFGRSSNTLVLIAPLPGKIPVMRPGFGSKVWVDDNDEHYCGYADYYAIKMFIEQTTKTCEKPRFIVFVGELGVADGSRGMYRFLMEHPVLKLIHRRVVTEKPSPFNKDYLITQEIFIFQI